LNMFHRAPISIGDTGGFKGGPAFRHTRGASGSLEGGGESHDKGGGVPKLGFALGLRRLSGEAGAKGRRTDTLGKIRERK